MWTIQKQDIELLKSLCSIKAPSSHEIDVQKFLSGKFNDMGLKCMGDAMCNLYCTNNPDADFKVAIIAHSDEIGLQISSITESGLLRFRKIGGIKPTSLLGHKVVVLTRNGDVDGIVGSDVLQDNETENGYLTKTSDLWIDVGASSKEECSKMVQLGDFAVFECDFTRLGTSRLASKSFDDRLGIFVMLKAMEILNNCGLSIGVTAFSSVQEEIQLRGAAACNQNFNAALVLDVDFATDIPSCGNDIGSLVLGGGIGINLNADSNVILQDTLKKVAADKEIPIQVTLGRNVSGGTDAAKIQLKNNVAAININLPLRYMHSQYEVCDIKDIESMVNAVVELVRYIDRTKLQNFVPWNS